jgi:hypothetical protein
MSTTALYNLNGIAAIIAGVLIILGALLNDLRRTEKGAVFNFLGALIGLYGFTISGIGLI